VDDQSRAPSRLAPRTLAVLLVAFVLLVAACTGGGSTPGPDASATIGPGVTGTPTPSGAASPTPATFPLTLTDDEDNEVTLAAEPASIVSLTPAVTETLFALGVGDRVVATTDFDDYPPEAIGLPDVASYAAVDVEAIVALEPDLVIAGGNFFNDPEALARLRTLGIPVLVVYAPDVETVLDDIELIGRAVGATEAATTMVTALREDIAAVIAATGALERPRVFYELDATSDIYGPADDSFLAEMIVLAGGEPITTGDPTIFSIPLERLVEADPEVILLGDAAYGVTAEQVVARPGWATMTAVTTDAIRPVDDVIVTRPGPRLTLGLAALATAIHPDVDVPVEGVPAASVVP
jgi:iron complex transport system substrate-binding protein